MTKKILTALLLAVLLTFSALAQPAMQETETAEEITQEFAENETAELTAYSGTCGTNLTWTLDKGTLTISGTGAMTNWDMSDGNSSNNVPWDSYRSSIKRVVISDSVTSIGGYAFYSCKSLTSITIPDSVTSIGKYAFCICKSLTSIEIPDSVTSIGNNALAECDNLTSVTIGNSVTSIDYSVFYLCKSLTSIEIPSGVTSIGDSAFYNCTSLTSITIPDSVTSIGKNAFCGCDSLTTVHYSGTSADFENITIGSSYYIDYFNSANKVFNKFIILYDANGGYNAPEAQIKNRGTDLIITFNEPKRDGYEFLGWSTVQNGEVEYVHGNVYSKNEDATLYAVWVPIFSGNCGFNLKWKIYGTKLTITGTGSMTNWSESANVPWNAHKSKIETVVISDGATSIGSYAFSDCENLKTVTFTESVTKINSHAFDNAPSMETTNFTGSLEDLENIEISDYNDSFMNGSFNFDYVMIYTIYYEILGGMSDIQEQSKNHGEPITLSTEVPKKIGHAFLGWSVEQGGEAVYNTGDEYTENADIVLYAVWEEVMGDASGDGEITNEDITIVADAIFGKTLTEEEFKYANVYDEDNEINVKDLIKLAQMMSQNK